MKEIENENVEIIEVELLDQDISKPPNQKQITKRNHKIIAVLIAILFILMVIFFVLFTSRNIPKGYYIKMIDTNTAEYRFEGEFVTYSVVNEMRKTIDEYGNQDGEVSENEVRNYEKFLGEDYVGTPSHGLRINYTTGEYTRYSISIHGATGDIDSEKPISVVNSYTVNWQSIETGENSYIIRKSLYYALVLDFKFISPPGYKISNVDGLTKENYDIGSTTVTGRTDVEAFGVDIYIIKN
jgi:hypothetical protein